MKETVVFFLISKDNYHIMQEKQALPSTTIISFTSSTLQYNYHERNISAITSCLCDIHRPANTALNSTPLYCYI